MYLLVLMLGCGMFGASPEEELAKTRVEQEAAVAKLYADYGGSQLSKALEEAAKAAKEGTETPDEKLANAFLEGFGGAAAQADRATFESHCLAVGRGESPTFLTNEGREFFAKKSTVDTCVAAAKRDKRMKELREQLGQ
jgi:hypothetical protein